MWVITYRGKPATLEKIYHVERSISRTPARECERDSYIVGRTKKMAIELYLYHIGFSWSEREGGIEVVRWQ